MVQPPQARPKIGLIGVGRMGLALAHNWIHDPQSAGIGHVFLVDPVPSDDVELLGKHPVASLNAIAEPVDTLVIAVKPQMFEQVAPPAAAWANKSTLVLSVMAGVNMNTLGRAFPGSRVARCMPNTPGAIGRGATGYCLSEDCKPADGKKVERLLAPLGIVEGPLKEELIDAVTAISGSGPAYVFFLAEVMAAAGKKLGLPEDVAERLAKQTVIGAGALMDAETGQEPADLRKAVTSPNGTTQAALDVLMKPGGLPDIVREAAEAAAKRAYDLSRSE